MKRAIVLWISGLLAAAIAGGAIGSLVAYGEMALLLGMLAGALAFTCARLWATERRAQKDLPVRTFDNRG